MSKSLTKEDLIAFVDEEVKLWEAGKLKIPCHFSGGNEDQLIEIFKEIRPYDYVFSGHRNSYHALLHGVGADVLMDEICGISTALCKGRARSMGFIDHRHKFYASAIVGGCVNIAVGVAVALKRSNADELRIDEMATPPRHVWCFVGDGAVDGGHFWEALQYAEGQELPITFVIEDNDRATCTDVDSREGKKHRMRTGLLTQSAWGSKYIKHYFYEPTFPHVGTGKYIQF